MGARAKERMGAKQSPTPSPLLKVEGGNGLPAVTGRELEVLCQLLSSGPNTNRVAVLVAMRERVIRVQDLLVRPPKIRERLSEAVRLLAAALDELIESSETYTSLALTDQDGNLLPKIPRKIPFQGQCLRINRTREQVRPQLIILKGDAFDAQRYIVERLGANFREVGMEASGRHRFVFPKGGGRIYTYPVYRGDLTEEVCHGALNARLVDCFYFPCDEQARAEDRSISRTQD